MLSVLKKIVNTNTPIFATIIIDLLKKCEIQKFLKLFLICPIIKRPYLYSNDFGHFRPIPMLPVNGKLFEENISKQLINYINDNNLVDVYQSAYRKGYNTEIVLLFTMNDIYFSLDKHSRFHYYNLTFHLLLTVFLMIYLSIGYHKLALLEML